KSLTDYTSLAKNDPEAAPAGGFSARLEEVKGLLAKVEAIKRRTKTEPDIRAGMNDFDARSGQLTADLAQCKSAVQERLALKSQKSETYGTRREREPPGMPREANAAWSAGLDTLKVQAGDNVQTASEMVKAWRGRFDQLDAALKVDTTPLKADWLKADVV